MARVVVENERAKKSVIDICNLDDQGVEYWANAAHAKAVELLRGLAEDEELTFGEIAEVLTTYAQRAPAGLNVNVPLEFILDEENGAKVKANNGQITNDIQIANVQALIQSFTDSTPEAIGMLNNLGARRAARCVGRD